MKIVVLGAGAWGTALALSAASHPQGHAVTLWARDAAQVAAMQATRCNARYLPGVALPERLALAAGSVPAAVHGADLRVVATPMAALRAMPSGAADLDQGRTHGTTPCSISATMRAVTSS